MTTLRDARGAILLWWDDGKKHPELDEVAAILNQHDALLAERDELQAQRDALVVACEAMQYALENVPIGEIWTEDETDMVESALSEGDAALALVRGEAANG
jgi:hypothetical protein